MGRSAIDLGQIAKVFEEKYGNVMTLTQFITTNRESAILNDILFTMLITVGGLSYSGQSALTVNRRPKDDSSDDDSKTNDGIDDLHRIIPAELGQLVTKKMNNKTLDRLWKHLDEDGSKEIGRDDVLNVLQWMGVLYIAFRFRV